MDEGLLNDLLECSVCLERLDTSSRVLPCQHTFCLKCLKVIVESHKELRCPECRILVEVKVEELPPNVLLMRILEGMKNSAPRKAITGQRTLRTGHSQVLQGIQGMREGKQPLPQGKAIYDYISKEPGDLSFKKGDTIVLQKKLDPFWCQGECAGRTGMFPITYVQVIIPLPTPTALCKALYDFRMSAPDEEGCLAFDKGAIITVHRRVDENWAEGRLEQRVGIFPIAFVELNQPARQLMNSVPLNRAPPPLPELRAGHSEHRHHAQHSHRYQPMSMSTPATVQSNYQNMPTMSQSHPNYQPMLAQQPQILVPQPLNQHAVTTISHGGLVTTTAVPRTIMEPTQTKHSLDLIQFTNMHNKSYQGTMGIQSVSRIGENHDRLRTVKYDSYNSTPVHKVETAYQNVRTHEHFPVSVANFNANNVSSDSSSSMNTPSVGVSSTTTPNTSDTSTSESAEPSLPGSPDNTERNATVVARVSDPTREPTNESPNTSMGVLSVNESSTATNTSLNVTLPPADTELNAPEVQVQAEAADGAGNNDPSRLEAAAAGGRGSRARAEPERRDLIRREKRHSLTPHHSTHTHAPQNRHSAELLSSAVSGAESERSERRRRRERSAERPLPAAYVALYPYRPQKPDELELKKGAVYTVTERCRDGWFKGRGEREPRAGVFPGNYVAPAPHSAPQHTAPQHTAPQQPAPAPAPAPAAVTLRHAHDKTQPAPAPDAPPRAAEPHPPHHQPTVQPLTYPWSSLAQPQQTTPRSEKSKEKSKAEKSISSGVSLMKRLAAMKKCKSPPPAGYSMDNPVFEDGPGPSLVLTLPAHHQPVHVRATENPWQSQHRKSQSLDVTATRRDRHHSQTVKERFRCIVPYPPNSEYELELKVDDIVVVSRKRGDGWYKGTLQRTGRSGLFPASFVQSCPAPSE